MQKVHGLRLALAATIIAAGAGHSDAVEAARQEAPTEPALLDNMDGPKPVLRLLNPGTGIRLDLQEVARDRGRQGGPAERLLLTAPAGASAQIGYRLPPSSVIKELRLSAS